MRKFPPGVYGRQRMQFYPAPFRSPIRAFAALVFPYQGDNVLVCDIEGRGWTIPSGRVEPSESSLQAAIREAQEEAGAELADTQYIGCYRISERGEVRWADCFVARVAALGEIKMQEESRGRRFATDEELPALYHWWSPLTALVFQHAKEVYRRGEDRLAR